MHSSALDAGPFNQVKPGGPAAASLRIFPGDLIDRIDGKQVAEFTSYDAMADEIRRKQSITLDVLSAVRSTFAVGLKRRRRTKEACSVRAHVGFWC